MESCHDIIQDSYRFVRFLQKKRMSNAFKIRMDFEKLIYLFETNDRDYLIISWKIPFFNKSIIIFLHYYSAR